MSGQDRERMVARMAQLANRLARLLEDRRQLEKEIQDTQMEINEGIEDLQEYDQVRAYNYTGTTGD